MVKKSSIIVVLIIIGAIALIFGRSYFSQTATQPSRFYPSTQKPTQTKTVQMPANAPAIVKAVMSRSIDAKGNATSVGTTFNAKTDKLVYAVLNLKNATKNTKLSYVRYLNGKYVDSKVALPTKDGITTFYFAFEKGIGDYPKGTYALNLYVNGRRSQSLIYVFK